MEEYITNNPEIIKNIGVLLSTIVTVTVAFIIAYYARKAPVAVVKLEQLKLIQDLTKAKAWLNTSHHFIVEEAFRQYFGGHIPIAAIKVLCKLDSSFTHSRLIVMLVV